MADGAPALDAGQVAAAPPSITSIPISQSHSDAPAGDKLHPQQLRAVEPEPQPLEEPAAKTLRAGLTEGIPQAQRRRSTVREPAPTVFQEEGRIPPAHATSSAPAEPVVSSSPRARAVIVRAVRAGGASGRSARAERDRMGRRCVPLRARRLGRVGLKGAADAKRLGRRRCASGRRPLCLFGVGRDLALRVYTTRLLGRDPKLVLHGGGNTSVKTMMPDLLGEQVEVLCVKGSGSDMATIEPAGLPAVRLARLRKLRARDRLSDEDMVRIQRENLLDPTAPNPSVETLLHAFLPHKFIDHTHASAVLSLVDQPDGEEICIDLYERTHWLRALHHARICARAESCRHL